MENGVFFSMIGLLFYSNEQLFSSLLTHIHYDEQPARIYIYIYIYLFMPNHINLVLLILARINVMYFYYRFLYACYLLCYLFVFELTIR